MKHKLIAALLAAVLTCNCIGMEQSQIIYAKDGAADMHCTYYTGTNISRQNYNIDYSFNSAKTNASSLVPLSDGGWMCVQGEVSALNGDVLVEYYDADFQLLERKTVPKQLPIYGGFHAASDGCYYLITGQDNVEESESLPVFDIAKYTSDWELAGHDQLCGANTAKPFNGGSVRFADNGKYLVIMSCHEMFDGCPCQGHQSSLLIEFDMETAKVSDHNCNYGGAGRGCVSHSLNQFVLMNGTQLVTLDHGDAYPRYVVLNAYSSDFTTGSFRVNNTRDCTAVDMFDYFPKDTHSNYTGVTVGGFEQSNTHYLTALNTIDQSKWEEYAAEHAWYDSDYLYKHTHNIVVSSVPKDSLDNDHVQKFEITNFAEGEPTTQTPHLTPIDGDRFLLLWQQRQTVNYVILDNTGAPITEIYTMDGEMSDCKPVQVGSQVYWYTWRNQDVTLYSIDVSNPAQTNTIVSNTAHDYHLDEEPDENGILHDTCRKCGDVIDHTVPTSMKVYPYKKGYKTGAGGSWPYIPQNSFLDAGDQMSLYVEDMEPANLSNTDKRCVTELIDGDDVVHLITDNDFHGFPIYEINEFGDETKTYTLKIYPYYNPALAQTFTFNVGHHYGTAEIVEPAGGEDGYITWKCTECGFTKKETIQELAATDGSVITPVLKTDSFEYNHHEHKPSVTLELTNPDTETTTLREGTDFTVRYIDNVNSGTAKAIITATEDSTLLTGTMTVPFTITPQSLDECRCEFTPGTLDVELPETILYEAAKPSLRFYDKQGYYIKPEDYYIKGAYISTPDCLRFDYIDFAIHAQAQNYTNSTEIYYPFPLIDLSDYQAEFKNADLAATGKVTYSGYEKNPLVEVSTSKGRVLEPDTDYIVTYADTKEIGTATVTIEGIGFYKGTITMHFDIIPKSQPAPPPNINGDLDGDGELSTEDACSLADILTGQTEISEAALKAADFNHDDNVNAVDLSMMKQQLLQQ